MDVVSVTACEGAMAIKISADLIDELRPSVGVRRAVGARKGFLASAEGRDPFLPCADGLTEDGLAN